MTGARTRIGLIGLGSIAHKAYLPVLATRPGLEPHLHSTSTTTLESTGDSYRVPATHRHLTLDGLLAADLDAAFVHAPTAAHPGIVGRLLEAGVPTYVDKPLAYELAEAERLVRLARERGVSLAVGFNRRYAPGYAQCREHPRDLIRMEKNRIGQAADPRTVVYDDFIHVVDTLRFLAPGPIDHVDIRVKVHGGQLHHVLLQLSGGGAGSHSFTALGMMNRRSGSAEERLDVMGEDSKREVINLSEVVDHKGQPSVRRRGDWVPVARQRGIEQITLAFLDAVRAGRLLTAEDALHTHELCERIVTAAAGAEGD